jgi:uncharacterized protein (TIGR02271 family)
MKDTGNHEQYEATKVSVPIVEEQIKVGSRKIVTERVLINKNVEEHEELINLPLLSENYRVERIPINLTVDSPPSVRHVGDTIVIPVIEEVAVVKKQLVLREELRITRVRSEHRCLQRVRLMREKVDVSVAPPQDSDIEEFYRSGVMSMPKTIVGLFDDRQKAQRVVQELTNAGYPQGNIYCITSNGGMSSSTDVTDSLIRAGVPTEEVRQYSSEIESGNSVVVLKATEAAAQPAITILERNGAKDLYEMRGQATAGSAGNQTTGPIRADNSSATAIPVVEEDIKVGKRQVPAGNVRISTRVTEQPIEQDVSLAREQVNVERRSVNRPATEQDLREFKEGTIEVTAMAEEPVVVKEAKVVEEVVVSKDVVEETRTIRDTVRKTEVDLDEKPSELVHGEPGQYRETVAGKAGPFGNDLAEENLRSGNDEYAYTYGEKLASDPRYRGKDWATIEPEAQREWGTHHKGAWQEFKDKVRHAWEKMTGE